MKSPQRRITARDDVYPRTRDFTDSGIIGTREYVRRTYRQVADKFAAKKDKVPKPISGLEGIYSLKRLM